MPYTVPAFQAQLPVTMTTAGAFTDEAFETFVSSLNEPDWLIRRRRQAWEAFQSMPWPSRTEEEWMRTDIRLFKLDRYAPQGPASASGLPSSDTPPSEPPALALKEGVELSGWLDADGGSLRPELAEQGVVFSRLGDAVQSHGELLERHLFRDASTGEFPDRFAALHQAWCDGGAVLVVPRGVSCPLPFHVGATLGDGRAELGHVLVVLEDGAEATLLSEMAGSAGGLHCGGVELAVGRGAHLRFVELQQWGPQAWQFAHEQAVVGADATLQWTIAAMGTRLAKVNQRVALAGPGARSQVNGVLFTEGKQHLAYHTQQHHQAPHCTSDFLYKAALQDQSRTVWRGMIKVDPAAQKTDGYQRNDNLLLSAEARADSIPGLEIEADDVRCTHGSTSGRVDEELLFYAQCRGFTRNEAVRAVVSGFFQQIFDRITIESVREALGHAIARRVRNYE